MTHLAKPDRVSKIPVVSDGNSDLALPTSANGWPPRPFQIVSLLDVKKYHLQHIQNVSMSQECLQQRITGFDLLTKDETVFTQEQIVEAKTALAYVEKNLKYLALKQSLKYVEEIRKKLESGDEITWGDYGKEAEILQRRVDHELEDITFGFIPQDHAKYFDQEALFGTEVNANFPSSKADIKEAGTCYTHGTYTACVFHLTRVLEGGLKALAAYIGAPFADINAENWETIINGIEGEIKRKRQNPKSSQKAADLEFYAGAAKQFRYFKEHWRNPVDHFRGRYDGPQALSALNHVGEFMRDMASKGIKE